MIFELRDATGESSVTATIHGGPREPPVSASGTRICSPCLQTVSEPHTVIIPPPTRRDSISSGLEAASPAEQKMPPRSGAGSGSRSEDVPPPRPPQHWAGMIPWDREAEHGKTAVHCSDGEKGQGNKRRRRWIWILGIVVLLVLITALSLGLGLGLSMRNKRLGELSGDRPSA